jgi:hypothetical protein
MHRVDDAELAESRIHLVREPITGAPWRLRALVRKAVS